MITQEMIDDCTIPSDEIKSDIEITLQEIIQYEEEADHLAQTPLSSRDARWNHMRAESYRRANLERIQFIEDLKAILVYRELKALDV